MPPRVVTSEEGVLKLVFLGWLVEFYYEPITAGEVMLKNPQHSVTLPDFWTKPWIVIQPESILKPGRVFYIIPNHVIRDLIRAYRLENQIFSTRSSSQNSRESPTYESEAKKSPSSRDPGRIRLQKQLSVDDPRAKLIATLRLANHHVKQQQSPRISNCEMIPEQQTSSRHLLQKPSGCSPAISTYADQDHDQFFEKDLPLESCSDQEVLRNTTHDHGINLLSSESRSWVESWLEMTIKQQPHQEIEKGSLGNSWFGVRPHHTSKDDYHTSDSAETPTQLRAKKSCLRTQSDNGRKPNGRRVTFVLPLKEQREIDDEFLLVT